MGRSFLLGIALGIVIGLYAAPMLGRPRIGLSKMSNVLSKLGTGSEHVPDKATRPTDDRAKSELFRISKWDITKHGDGSTVNVKRCISIYENTVACELVAHLGWIEGEKLVESIFEGGPDGWNMVAAKNR
ncbi:hypothetical protein [Rhizobium sullae]|uniref:hypothetical protein n=1 Tax=Rhizobium sullae TaxID=50338 RepID=UPI000B3627CB|nr:hypothetical protein [Rhizobium sullae]